MSKYSALFEDEDDVFLGSPKSKFFDVVFNANNDVARYELEDMIDRMATMELLLEERMGSLEEIEDTIKEYKYSRTADIEAHAKNTYIYYMGAILSKSE
jgi:Domain of unknown function (DUF2018)